MAFQQIPRHVCRKFFNFPSEIPKQLGIGFMPKVKEGEQRPDLVEVERWCRMNLGHREVKWTRRSIYFFMDENDAFMFKMRWC
jgi:hypothetical protein